MTASSRFVRARVVSASEFRAVEFAGEAVAGPKRRLSKRERQIRRLLRKARALKKRIAHLRIRHPLGWKGAVRQSKTNLRVVMSDLKALGWKPKRPTRARKPGEDELDAALDDIPEPEPGESDDGPEDSDEPTDAPDAEPSTEGNWLDGYVGVEKPMARAARNLLEKAATAARGGWRPFDHLGENARIQTRSGQSAMISTVKPGLFIVQIVSDEAARKIAGDNVGILPLLLYPLVKDSVRKALTPKGAPPAPAAQPAAAPAPAAVGCDRKDGR